MGRPTKCTPEVTAQIARYVRGGMGREAAARLAGVGPSTFYRWMVDGEAEEEGIYREFRETILNAEARLQRQATLVLKRQMRSSNQGIAQRAAMYVLTNRFPREFSARHQVEATGRDGGPVAVEVSGSVEVRPVFTDEQLAAMSAEQLEAALGVLLKARGA